MSCNAPHCSISSPRGERPRKRSVKKVSMALDRWVPPRSRERHRSSLSLSPSSSLILLLLLKTHSERAEVAFLDHLTAGGTGCCGDFVGRERSDEAKRRKREKSRGRRRSFAEETQTKRVERALPPLATRFFSSLRQPSPGTSSAPCLVAPFTRAGSDNLDLLWQPGAEEQALRKTASLQQQEERGSL